ncbi:MAG: 3-phosphoshikimate 1-carboxyvinyltransferase [Planctomycetota bacterium]|jgi:3-phosphoshikimate 1-carboxyvinyltransferase|nr:3-phosphoshikimate 1-carboxyvinyltransferase [Deltaproteobacteria bacterium]MDP6540698.1 3-phosphoshikimate 1-carboxyvinyltransferase [Planctomycetota bacterium]
MAASGLPDPLPIQPRGPLDGSLRPPGSRSLTNRALIAAALAEGESRLPGATESDDTLAMADGLAALGVPISRGPGAWRVAGQGGRLRAAGRLDVRASGTTARFLTAVATLAEGESLLDGVARMRERPIEELVTALRDLGAAIEILGERGCPPLRIAGGGLRGGEIEIDASRSSQFVSGLLLAAPGAAGPVTLHLAGGRLVSRPFLELTVEVMGAFGVPVAWNGRDELRIPEGSRYQAREYPIEPDAQAAVYPFCAAAIAGGEVRVEGIPGHSRQTDLRLLEVLEAMGCAVERETDHIAVRRAPDRTLRGVEFDGNAFPDAVLALAVVALFAEGPTTARGLGHLPLKETDRLAALRTELRRLGAGAETGADWIRIDPAPLHGAAIETYDDHRMAMSFALAGLRVPGVEIRDPGCVAKTWPDYFEALDAL